VRPIAVRRGQWRRFQHFVNRCGPNVSQAPARAGVGRVDPQRGGAAVRDVELFQVALGLVEPWYVKSCRFDAETKRLDIDIDFKRGARFTCPEGHGVKCPVHDTVEKTWRHLDFFQHEAYINARVPRITNDNGDVRLVTVPWARPGSGFTLLFEALIMMLVPAMPVRQAGELVGEHDTRLWRILHHHVDEARAKADHSSVNKVAIDEKAVRRGHNYVTLFVDMDERRVLFVTEGKDASTVEMFADDLEAHGGDASRVKQVSIDMSAAFIKGVTDNLTEAEITFDKFHAVKLVNDAVDKVRREEVKFRPELKKSRYLWLKNEPNLSADGRETLASLTKMHLRTGRAYQMRLAFQEIYEQPNRQWGGLYLNRWLGWAKRSRLEPMKAVARTIDKHYDGILAWFDSRINNGIMEGINSVVQAAKVKARGYRTLRCLSAMTYLLAGRLTLKLPT
jgi:transposase